MSLLRDLSSKLHGAPVTIALSEGEDPRIIAAAVAARKHDIARLILVGDKDIIARALRDGVFRMAGSRRSLKIEPRIVLLCDIHVQDEAQVEDLLGAGLEPELVSYMEGWVLRLPPIRERISDLPLLIDAEAEGSQWEFSSGALQRLQAHDWPGNEAELRTIIGRLAGRSSRLPVQTEELEPLLQSAPSVGRQRKGRTEKDLIVDALWRNSFNRSKAAEVLGISRKTLYNKIRKYELSG